MITNNSTKTLSAMAAIGVAASFTLLAVFTPTAHAESDPSEVVAEVAGDKITRGELEKTVRPQLIEIENSRYDALRGGLEQMIAERLLDAEAKERGISREEFEKTEVIEKLTEPTEEEISALYEANKARIGGAPLEAVRNQVVEAIGFRQQQALYGELLEGLRKKHGAKVTLLPPVYEVALGDLPPRGGKDAAVTIVGFSDYECPYCREADETIDEVLEKYGDKVRYVHRDFPLSFHANAQRAAEASRCANDQGKYWEYHGGLFEKQDLSGDALGAIADDIGLDRSKFDECLKSEKHKESVESDLEAGAGIGVNGTPAFFINGRVLSAGRSVEAFSELIDPILAEN